MVQTHFQVDQPVVLGIDPNGDFDGATRHYEKKLGDMRGVYGDAAAWENARAVDGDDHLVYYVNDQKYQDGPGALIVGTSVLLPGRYGNEFAVTRGHLHGVSDRAELYHCLSGHGVMLLETVDGQSEAIELTPGKAVNVPGEWIHRSVNVGDEPFVTLFCYAADAGQNYEIISAAGGMKNRIVATDTGWTVAANPEHTGYTVEATE